MTASGPWGEAATWRPHLDIRARRGGRARVRAQPQPLQDGPARPVPGRSENSGREHAATRRRPILLADPAHQVGVDARQEDGQCGSVERTVVPHPSSHDGIDHLGEFGPAQLGSPV